MKKVLVSLLVAAFVASSAAYCFASELDFYGYYRAAFSFVDNNAGGSVFNEDTDGEDFHAYQRVRQYFEYVTNENLKAVVGYEIDSGFGWDGGDFGADETGQLEIKRAMVDFNWPETDINFRVGIQGFALPGGAMGNPVLGGDMAGVIVSTPINDMLGVTAGWVRGYDGDQIGDQGAGDEIDVAMLSLPITGDGFSVNPYFVYAWLGEDAMEDNRSYVSGSLATASIPVAYAVDPTPTPLIGISPGGEEIEFGEEDPDANVTFTDDANAWWLGFDYNVNMFDPINISGQFIYGSSDGEADVDYLNDGFNGGDDDFSGDVAEREGWYMDFMVDYVMDNMTPSLFFLYSSGDDDDLGDGSETFPMLHNDGFVNPPVAGGFGFTGCQTSMSNALNYSFAQYVPAGIWKLGFALKNLTFMDNLSHTIGLAYVKGTNDADVGRAVNLGTGGDQWTQIVMTDDDDAWEFSFRSAYSIYEALSLTLDYEYASLDMDEDVWGDDYLDDEAQHLTLGVCYSF